jgi:hypothetical protein
MSDTDEIEETTCGLTANERGALARELRALPDTMPPRIVWTRIREQAEAEGLIKVPAHRRRSSWFAGIGLAAAVVLAVLIIPIQKQALTPEFAAIPAGDLTNTLAVNVLEALMVESRELENDLRSLPEEPRVVRAGTRATILELEDRISAIDYQLTDPDVLLTPEEQEIFWRERVRLMKSLVRLRYAQAQRAAF